MAEAPQFQKGDKVIIANRYTIACAEADKALKAAYMSLENDLYRQAMSRINEDQLRRYENNDAELSAMQKARDCAWIGESLIGVAIDTKIMAPPRGMVVKVTFGAIGAIMDGQRAYINEPMWVSALFMKPCKGLGCNIY